MKFCCSCVTLLILTASTWAWADGGIVRVSQTDGPWRITVFSSPTPLRVGPADLSVLVQEASSDTAILDATVSVHLEFLGALSDSILAEATPEAAENRLLQSALIDLPQAGRWKVEVTAMRGSTTARVSCEVVVSPPLPPILELWIWFVLPIIMIVLIIINQWLQRRGRQPSRITSHE